MNLETLFESRFLVILLGFFREMDGDWVLARLYVDTIWRFAKGGWEQSLVLLEIVDAKGGRHDDQAEWVVGESDRLARLDLLLGCFALCVG